MRLGAGERREGARQRREAPHARLALVGALVAAFLLVGAAPALAEFSLSGPTSTSEGASGETHSVTYTITRTTSILGSPAASVHVLVGKAGDTATSGADYSPVQGTQNGDVSFPSCSILLCSTQTATVSVPILGDDIDEPDSETFTVTLDSASGDTIDSSASSVATSIADDDDPPTVSIDNAAPVVEGTGASSAVLHFPVILSSESAKAIAVDYATTDTGTATAGTDFTAVSGTLNFAPGTTVLNIDVPVTADNIDEVAETVIAQIKDPVFNVTLGATTSASGTINNDDVPFISIGQAPSQAEGNSGTTIFVFHITLSNPSTRTISAHVATADGTAHAPEDYTADQGTVIFAPGQTDKLAGVAVVGDTVVEGDETFTVGLSAPVGANMGAPNATATILNDDAAPVVTGGGTGSGTGTGTGSIVTGVLSPATTPTATTPKPAILVSQPSFVRPGVVKVRVTCPVTQKSCRGTLAVLTIPVPKSKVKSLRHELKVGSTIFVLQGGQVAKLTLRVSKKILRIVKSAKRVRVKAFAVSHNTAGQIVTAQRIGTMRRFKR
jgi:hypothetical protein